MENLPVLQGRISAPADSTPQEPTQAPPPNDLERAYHLVFGPTKPRRRATWMQVIWTTAWILLALFTRGLANEQSYAAARSQYIYLMWVLSIGGAVAFILYIWVNYQRISVVQRMLVPNGIALLIWMLVMYITMDWRIVHLLVIVAGARLWRAVVCRLPIWPAVMENAHVYYHLQHGRRQDEFTFITRGLLKVDHQRLVELADAGITFDQMRLYLNAGAPPYLRDELSASLLGKYYRDLQTLNENFPAIFRALNFKLEPYDIQFTQANIQHAFTSYRTAAKSALSQFIRAEAQQPMLISTPHHAQARQNAQRAYDTVEVMFSEYKRDVTRLTKLFVDSDDPLLMPNSVFWISAFDEWKFYWNKNTGIPVSLDLAKLRTRENLEFDFKVTCACQFEPEKIRDPGKRDKARALKDEDAIKKWVADAVIGFIKPDVHRYFQTIPTQVVLETGADDYQKVIMEKFKAPHIRILEPTLDCDVIPPYEVNKVRRKEFADEQEASQIRRLLSLGEMSPAQQAETMMQIMMLRFLPQGLQQVTRDMLPAINPQITIQPPPALPPGEQIQILPPDSGGHGNPDRGRRKDDTQTRRKLNLNFDEVIDLRPDDDDPNTYRPRQ